MPLSGVDGSKFNMKINLYVVSLDEHNVPRVERIQTTKDTKVLNTICLYYRIFFFHYKSCVVLLTSLKKKLLTMFTRCCAPEFALALFCPQKGGGSPRRKVQNVDGQWER